MSDLSEFRRVGVPSCRSSVAVPRDHLNSVYKRIVVYLGGRAPKTWRDNEDESNQLRGTNANNPLDVFFSFHFFSFFSFLFFSFLFFSFRFVSFLFFSFLFFSFLSQVPRQDMECVCSHSGWDGTDE